MPRMPPSPRFPLDSLTPWHRRMVEAVALSTQTDVSMSAMVSLAVLSATVARKAVVRESSGRTTPLNLWVLAILEPSEGKTPAFRHLMAPLEVVQRRLERPGPGTAATPAPAVEPPRPTAWERLLWDDEFENPARSEAPQITLDEALTILRDQQDARHPGVPAQFLTRDVTPAALVDLMANQCLGIAQMSAEGGFAAWISTVGSRGLNDLATLNLAWDGEAIRAGRRAQPIPPSHRSALTVGVAVQPSALRQVLSNPQFRGVGYLARFLYCYPEPHRGRTHAPFMPVPDTVAFSYTANVWAMLALPCDRRGRDGVEEPFEIPMSPEAQRLWDDWYNELEPLRAPNAPLDSVADWIEKLRQNTVRIAGVLHLSRYAGPRGQDAYDIPVSDETMASAIEIGRYLIPFGQRAMGTTSATPARPGSSATEPSTPSVAGQAVQDVVVAALLRLPELGRSGVWTGSATELYRQLSLLGRPDLILSPRWPRASNALTAHLREAVSVLAEAGLDVRMRRTNTGQTLTITVVPARPSPSSRPSPARSEAVSTPNPRDGGGDDGDDPGSGGSPAG
jgi:replicative DNA helicase